MEKIVIIWNAGRCISLLLEMDAKSMDLLLERLQKAVGDNGQAKGRMEYCMDTFLEWTAQSVGDAADYRHGPADAPPGRSMPAYLYKKQQDGPAGADKKGTPHWYTRYRGPPWAGWIHR